MNLDRKTITRKAHLVPLGDAEKFTARVWHGPRDEYLELRVTTGRAPWGYTNEQNESNQAPCDQLEITADESKVDVRGRMRTTSTSLCLSREQAVALRDLLNRAYPA